MAQPSPDVPPTPDVAPAGRAECADAASDRREAPVVGQHACYQCGEWNDSRQGAPFCASCGADNTGFTTRLRVKPASPLASAGAELAWVLRDLLEALPPFDPASGLRGADHDLSRGALMEVLPGIGVAARAAVDRWEAEGGAFAPPSRAAA